MSLIPLLVWAVIGVAAIFYAHSRIARYTAKANNVVLLRLVLLATGIGLGYVMMDRSTPLGAALSFLGWFGAVHLPAAGILFLKGLQRADKS